MIKEVATTVLDYLGFRVTRKIPSNHKISKEVPSREIDRKIVDEIFNFFDLIPPFYDSSVRDELKISGAWGQDLKERRKNQLDLLKSRNSEGYAVLLDSLLTNELVSGQWSISYFEQKLLNKKAPEHFLANLKLYENLTGDTDYGSLIDGDFGGRWGVKIGNRTLLLVDPYKGINAFNAANYLNSLAVKKNIYLDFGSGIGSDCIKVSKMVARPTRFLLCDIPLNLTTAFAYVSANVKYQCHLVSSTEQLQETLKSNFSEHEFIFVPSIFVEELAKQLVSIDLMYNHGSFSEMDYDTVKFYIDVLLTKGPVKALFEINSNTRALNKSSHIEVPSSEFPLPETFQLIYKLPSVNIEFRHRYVQSLYKRT